MPAVDKIKSGTINSKKKSLPEKLGRDFSLMNSINYLTTLK
jgi:hypothetical protein